MRARLPAPINATAQALLDEWDELPEDQRFRLIKDLATDLVRTSASTPETVEGVAPPDQHQDTQVADELDTILMLIVFKMVYSKIVLTQEVLSGLLVLSAIRGQSFELVYSICDAGSYGRETKAATWKWNRMKYELLEFWLESSSNDMEPLDEAHTLKDQLWALGKCLGSISPALAESSSMQAWVARQALQVVKATGRVAQNNPGDIPDDWIGYVLTICDDLMIAGRVSEVTVILQNVVDTMGLFGPSSESSLNPGVPSRFREDSIFLLRMMDGVSNNSVAVTKGPGE